MYLIPFFYYSINQNNEIALHNIMTKQNLLSKWSFFKRLIDDLNVEGKLKSYHPFSTFFKTRFLFKSKSECLKYFVNVQKKRLRNFPFVKQVEMTNTCPNKCIMCPLPVKMRREIGYISLDVFKRICEQIAPWQKFLLLHHFGESLFHPELPEAISIASSFGIKTSLSCNAAFFNEQLIVNMLTTGISSITFCLDSLKNETYQLIRGTNKTVEENIEAISNFIELREKLKSKTLVSMQMIQMKVNLDEYMEFLKLGQHIGVDRATVKQLDQWDFSDTYIEKISAIERPNYYLPCLERWQSLCILWDGSVVPCCRDYNGDIVLGNINDDNLENIWTNAKYQKLREDESQFKRCRRCWQSWLYKEKKRKKIGYDKFHFRQIASNNALEWFKENAKENYNKINFLVRNEESST